MQMVKCLESLLLLKHTFLPKLLFSRRYGGVQNGSGNSKEVGGYLSGQKMEIPGRRGALT